MYPLPGQFSPKSRVQPDTLLGPKALSPPHTALLPGCTLSLAGTSAHLMAGLARGQNNGGGQEVSEIGQWTRGQLS